MSYKLPSSVTSIFFIDALLLINQINRLPPELVKFLTDPNYTEAPDMELLYPFVDSALPLAYGVLGVLLFHVRIHMDCFLFCVFAYSFCSKINVVQVEIPVI